MKAMKPEKLPFSPAELRKKRDAKGFSRAELAAITKLPPQTIQACESPKANPTVHTLRVLAKALNVVWLIDGVELPSSDTSEGLKG